MASLRKPAVALAALLTAGLLFAPALFRSYQEREVLRRTRSVITSVRNLARLETASYQIERVIDLRQRQDRLYGLVSGEDAVLLVASGEVVAGVDLSKMGEGDLRIDAQGRAVLRLPGPEVFHVRLDEDRTYVYSRQTDLLARRDERLEGRARQAAVDAFARAARDGAILTRAQVQAERLVRLLLRELGFSDPSITFASPPAG